MEPGSGSLGVARDPPADLWGRCPVRCEGLGWKIRGAKASAVSPLAMDQAMLPLTSPTSLQPEP